MLFSVLASFSQEVCQEGNSIRAQGSGNQTEATWDCIFHILIGIMCTKSTAIDTLNWYLWSTSQLTSQLILGQLSVDYWPSVNWLVCIDWKLVDLHHVNWGVDGLSLDQMLVKSTNQGHRLTFNHGCLWYKWSFICNCIDVLLAIPLCWIQGSYRPWKTWKVLTVILKQHNFMYFENFICLPYITSITVQFCCAHKVWV